MAEETRRRREAKPSARCFGGNAEPLSAVPSHHTKRGWSASTRRKPERHRTARKYHAHQMLGRRHDCFKLEGHRRVPPKCPACGGLLRPDVVWFEEPMPEEEMQQAMTASTHCDFFFSVGTSTVVYPAAALPSEALRSGATVVEINPQPTPFTAQAQFALAGAAGIVLPELVKALNELRGA